MSLGCDQHGEIISVHEADVEEIKAACAVQREFSKGGGRGGATAGAFESAGATVAGQASEFGILGAVSAGPKAA